MKSQNLRSRRGLTLIELVVVMAILAALAGILIPMLPGLLNRAHDTTSVTNGTEISKMVQTFQGLTLRYPNNLDDIGGGTGTPLSFVPGSTTGTAGGFTTVTLSTTNGYLAALQNAGITSVYQIAAASGSYPTNGASWSPTFFPYAAPTTGVMPTAVPLASGATLVGITPAKVANEFGISGITSTATVPALGLSQFVVLGLGRYSSMAGVAMQEAPVHFDDGALGNPSIAYERFGLVFQVADDTGTALDTAKFIGTVEFMSDGIEGISDHLQEFYNQ